MKQKTTKGMKNSTWKKRGIAGVLVFILALSVGACGKNGDVKEQEGETKTEAKAESESDKLPIAFQTVQYSEYEDYSIDVSYICPFLEDEYAEKYPELQNAMNEYGKNSEKSAKKSLEDLREYENEFLEEGEELNLLDQTKAFTIRADQTVTSILLTNDFYSGGAHGYYGYNGLNFDTKSGKELSLSDVLEDQVEFFEIVHQKLETQYEEDYDMFFDVEETLGKYGSGEDEDVSWTISNEGVTVYFNPYEIATYAAGTQIITVYFDEYPEIFNSKYTVQSDTYVIPYILGQVYEFDVDGNGSREVISVDLENYSSEYDEENYYDNGYTTKVSNGNRSVEVGYPSYSVESYFIKANDQYYLYVIQTMENDYNALYVVDLKNMSSDTERGESLQFSVYDYQDLTSENASDGEYFSTYCERGFTDPTNFAMDTRVDIMSTMNVSRTYMVDKDGYPKALDEYYTVDNERILKVKKDIQCDVVNEAGEVTGKETLPAGSYIFFVRTNGTDLMDVQMIDEKFVHKYSYDSDMVFYEKKENITVDYEKTVYRIKRENQEYPYMIGGNQEDDVLEGCAYAG